MITRKHFLRQAAGAAIGFGAFGLLLPSKTRADSVIVAVNSLNTIQMSNSTWGRPVSIPSTWTKVRVGLLISCHSTQSGVLVSNPSFAVGLCSGTSNMIGDLTPKHFVGTFTNQGTPTYWTGQPKGWSNILVYPIVNVNGSQTQGTQISNAWSLGYSDQTGPYRTLYYLDITKGSPNYTLSPYSLYNTTTAYTDSSVAIFLTNLPIASPGIGGSYTAPTGQTVPVNEATNGTLDTVNVWWNRADALMYVSAVGVAVLA